jgi:hypothetical protein
LITSQKNPIENSHLKLNVQEKLNVKENENNTNINYISKRILIKLYILKAKNK